MKCRRWTISVLLILSLIVPLIACSGARPKPPLPTPIHLLPVFTPSPIEPPDPIELPTPDWDNLPTPDFSDIHLATPDLNVPDINDYCQPSIDENGAVICDKDTPSWILDDFASCDQPFGPFSYRCYY